MPESLIIIDPIFRGSRLYFTRLAVRAAESLGMTCTILTRTDARTEQFEELFAGANVPVIEVANVDKDFWYGKISAQEQKRLVDRAGELVNGSDCALYLPGLNELWPDIASILKNSRLNLLPTLTIEYHPEYLLRASSSVFTSSLRSKFHQWRRYRKVRADKFAVLLPWLQANRRTCLYSLDERISDPKLANIPSLIERQVKYISDPAPVRTIATEYSRDPIQEVNLLLVGSQSARKGLSNIIRLCNLFPVKDLGMQFTLVGKLTQETELLRPQLKKHENLIKWTDAYVSEEEIALEYERADYVVLPYTRDFSGSSGVLGSAVAHRKPVLASDHGLVGHRVSAHGLGFTYPAQDLAQLWNQLCSLPQPHTDTYKKWVGNIERYAPLISEQNHIDQLVEFLQKPL